MPFGLPLQQIWSWPIRWQGAENWFCADRPAPVRRYCVSPGVVCGAGAGAASSPSPRTRRPGPRRRPRPRPCRPSCWPSRDAALASAGSNSSGYSGCSSGLIRCARLAKGTRYTQSLPCDQGFSSTPRSRGKRGAHSASGPEATPDFHREHGHSDVGKRRLVGPAWALRPVVAWRLTRKPRWWIFRNFARVATHRPRA